MATGIKLEGTKFVNEFYPLMKQSKLKIAFQPMGLLNSNSFDAYTQDKKQYTTEIKEILRCVFVKNENIPQYVHEIGDMKISDSGKEEDVRKVYHINHSYKTNPNLNTFLNFMYYDKGSFYALQPSGFLSNLKSSAYIRETKKYDQEALTYLHKVLNGEDKQNTGNIFLTSFFFKSGKTTLSKILISLFPELDMKYIVELSDFIKTEMLSNKSENEVSKNIFELKGDLATYFYNAKNYIARDEGSLGQSCMRGDGETERIRFYGNNPTNVSLLTNIENKKLLARSILWTDVEGKKFVDRIYCSSSRFGTRLAAYCKSKGYQTIYNGTESEYGIPLNTKCIVKLDSFELKGNNYPYLDTMAYIDIVNKLVSPDHNYLLSYSNTQNSDYIIKNINRLGGVGHYNDCNELKFKRNNSTEMKFLLDSEGQPIRDQLSRYAIIKKPTLCVVNRNNIVTLNNNEKTESTWCEDNLIKKYNSIRPTLIFLGEKRNKVSYNIQYYDKQFVVYSTYHKFYILKKESVYINPLKTFVIKDITNSASFINFTRVSKLRKIYGNKLVKINPVYLDSLKEQISKLPFKESLMDIRKSRVYSIVIKNILCDGVQIKGIIIPFNQLRVVKK